MTGFKIINNKSEITLNNKWVSATTFKSKDSLVDEKGHKVGSDYKGRQYRIIEKRERTFSCLERFGRGLVGTVAIICTLCLGLFSKFVRDLFTKSKESIRFAVLEPTGDLPLKEGSRISKKTVQNQKTPPLRFDPKKLSAANFSDFENTGKGVSGTGSGKCSIYRSRDGIEYVMKKNQVFEFYAGTLFQLMLAEHSAKVLFVRDGSDFYVGSQFEPSYREIWSYHSENGKIPEEDLEGLSLIIVASFILGEIDLKGLGSANSNVGLKKLNDKDIYFKIDHEQTFVFGGDGWRQRYVIDQNLKEKLRKYADEWKFNLVTDELLEKAVQQISSIPLTAIEETCDFCENQLKEYPAILQKQISDSSDALFSGLSESTTIKQAVLARFGSLRRYLKDHQYNFPEK